MVWLKLAVCIIVIFLSGQRVARYGDIIAEKTGLGRLWMGLIAIALITSLPELFTAISAVTLVDSPDLAVGDLIGANAFNMLNLALLDIAHRNVPILATASRTHQLTGWFSLLLIVVTGVSIIISAHAWNMSIGWVGLYTPIIVIIYLLGLMQIYRRERKEAPHNKSVIYSDVESPKKVYLTFGLSAAFIIGAGVWLATIGDEIAATTGWAQGFVGSLFLAFTTTLPEITVSFTAMRMGAIDMAVANMVGSNLFNLTIIPIADIIYSRKPLLANVSESHLATAAAVFFMTLLFIIGLRIRPKRYLRLSWWNVIMIILFLLGAYFHFTLA